MDRIAVPEEQVVPLENVAPGVPGLRRAASSAISLVSQGRLPRCGSSTTLRRRMPRRHRRECVCSGLPAPAEDLWILNHY